ncbi:polyamine ABC transporter substrate-binding protein [Allofrancisella guangzhouensis]|uniref:Putrescine-binding periplasmic protein n=1 Tax=Allofrancisella guangzhouensis TaxID=594679 RepID=A0A0A8E5Z6_9GAMM|nr:polyamine ABC transporter substrate-binding protein [Allofrancisella guangzhouensis]AJC49404.1 putrescine/spermidine ABC transporter substrate-binding protein [Allofrancisella guangzhouensis]MBK2026946.1 polyamine ABC transporter substrate-binding protein [Allofrancisella guangzhouensis]MBK2043946.1 polyamine ABC transporter substrate-binding protein [Allofrancisella guangzhouensis]MBK2046009.1 polyamine ABC transporter substrate-binding protein [Allofrancisella guangzhouensis]
MRAKNILIILLLTILNLSYAQDESYICSNEILKSPIVYSQEKGQINFTNWADYISPDIVPCFSKLSNTRIKYIYTSDDNMTRAKVMTGSSGFDLIEQGALYLNTEIASNALVELDKSKLPNLKYRNKVIYDKVSQINDPGNKYAVIYSYGTTGLAYNKEQIEEQLGKGVVPNSWEYVFNAKYLSKLAKCGVSLLDEPEQIFGNYFFFHGIDPNTTSKAKYEKAALDIIKNIRPYIKYFDSNKYQNDFTAGNLCLVMGYSGDVVRSVERAKSVNPNVTLAYVIPKEGTNIWFDTLMIPKGAKNLDKAYELMNYIIDPYIAAQNSNYLYQPNAVTQNSQYLDSIFDNKNIKPTDQMIKKMYVLNIHDAEMQSFISRMWMNVKYGIEFKPKYYSPKQENL